MPGRLEWALIVLAVSSFGMVAIAQAMFPLWAYHPAAAGLRTHLSNGLYANALFDRILGGWALRQPRAIETAIAPMPRRAEQQAIDFNALAAAAETAARAIPAGLAIILQRRGQSLSRSDQPDACADRRIVEPGGGCSRHHAARLVSGSHRQRHHYR